MTTLAASCVAVTPAAQADPADPGLVPQVEEIDSDGGEVRGLGWQPKPIPETVLPAPVWPKPGKAAAVAVSPKVRAASASAAVETEVIDRSSVPPRWQGGVVARLSAPSASAAAVAMNYSGFEHAYGGSWASRLRLWRLPECALTTPDKAGCTATPLRSRNDVAAKTVTADVSVAGASAQSLARTSAGTLVALAADPAGDSGDYSATSLSPSSTWSAGGSTGGFNWSYPMRTPPPIGGLQPEVALSYSSASVDGRSSATNNQPSWVGEGFDYSPGFIERQYVPCSDDKAGSDNNPERTGDLCWRSDNAVMSLGGSSAELVYQEGKGWHARSEGGSTIEKLTGAGNGDHNGEHWKVTTTDGTQYFFGRDDLPGQSADTASTWTVPVYGNHAGEPGHASTFADSRETQAWRWNLDYVIDVRGNTMSYWYDKETNQYAAEASESKNVSYVRGGSLARIDYGTWDRGADDRSVTPLARVVFDRANRCLSDCSEHDGSHWPDTPWDQECKSDATSCQDFSPTFWSTKRLTKVTTKVWDLKKSPADWQDVDSYKFEHGFPSPGDGQKGGLWLKSIVHAGHVGGTVTMPPVTLEPVAMPNRVLTKTNTTNNWQRLSDIYTETGARIQVTYSLPECTSKDLPSAPHTNTKLCYPVIGPDPYDLDGPDITEWWHKYVVRKISETDVQLTGGHQGPTINTYYTYEGDPAWHYADDDGLIKPRRKTWSQFRGYRTVKVQVGDTSKTLTKTTYLRGMHGDREAPSGGTREVTVNASVGSETVYDHDEFAGMVREEAVYNGTEDKPVSKTVNVPWRSDATASRTINGDTVTARFVDTATTYTGTALGVDGARGWRVTGKKTTFNDTYGTVDSVQDSGDTSKNGDEKCTSYLYARNTDRNVVTRPKRVTTTALPCGTPATSAGHMISDLRTFYDGATSIDTDPVRGEATRIDGLKDWTAAGGTTWLTSSTARFDAFGRQTLATDHKGNATSTSFAPSAGLVTKITETNSLDWTTVTGITPYWGLPTKVEDPNQRVTEIGYDALGRTEKVWEVGWARQTAEGTERRASKHYSYVYAPDRNAYPYVRTEALNSGGGVDVSYQIFDGLLRARQAQKSGVGGERVVTDTLYDAWGRPELTFGAHVERGEPSGALWQEPEWSVPTQDRTIYDRAGRATEVIFRSGDGVTNVVDKWKTTTVYEGDRTTVIPPKGGTTTTTVVDAQGRTVEGRQYTTAAGASGAFDATKYTYNAKDQLTKVVDAGLNEWTYTYDIRGRQVETHDPDRGRTTLVYNDTNELVQTRDAREETLAYTYDSLGRRTAVYDDSVADANKRAEWKYDVTVGNIKVRGQRTESIRYDGGHAYKWQAISFTDRYQTLAERWIIPSAETGLAGAHSYSYGYSPYTGAPTTMSYPTGGGLVPETVTTRYDEASGLPTKLETNMVNIGTYVTGRTYNVYGEPTVTKLGIAGGVYTQEATSYERDTRRVHQVKVVPETAAGSVSERTYNWEHNGNLLSIADAPAVGDPDTQCFDYDSQQRLTSAWTPKAGITCSTAPTTANLGGPAPYWLDWTIDKVGNRTKEVSHGSGGDTTRSFTYPASGAGAVRPHALTTTTTTAPGQSLGSTAAFGYDATGNMTTRPGPTAGQTLTWDAEGRPVKVEESGQAITNLFDADGNRLLRRDSKGTTLFLPGQEIRRTLTGGTTATMSGTRYYSFAGGTVATRTMPGTQTLSWLFGDHQGTQHVSVNAYSQKVTVRRQSPYGVPRGAQVAWPTMKGFVNGDLDPTGLTHIGAREYDPVLGRFISVDPLMNLEDAESWNGYAYADNNPIAKSDPSGLSCIMDDGSQCGPAQRTTPSKGDLPGGTVNHGGSGGQSGGRVTIEQVVRDKRYACDRNDPNCSSSATQWYRDQTFAQLQLTQQVAVLRHVLCGNDRELCKRIQEAEDAAGVAFFAELTGIADAKDCYDGSVSGCLWTAIGFVGPGKLKALKLGDDVIDLVRTGHDNPLNDLVAACARKSFGEDTHVLLADGSTKAIKDLRVGDLVMAEDPETGERGPRKILHVWVHDDDLYELDVNGSRLVTTEDHPFWNETDRRWERADELDRGDRLRASTGGGAIVGVLTGPPRVAAAYNLTVDGIHTYYVLAGNTPVLVHNDDPNWFPDRELPRAPGGHPMPDPDAAGYEHTQLGTKSGRRGSYPQAREFDAQGRPVRDIDFTDHGRPANHTNPHEHPYLENSTGGTPQRGPAQPMRAC
ncbi:polymorphic toxin-type HINT domain-containing protein [Jidongwangia harbinensis]|uniref:polymorphic toxin-type HINT domain-containing protein n=1 Tax=Jidongwangia harbinensis TaxID=2878561 RepID=UPI001CD9A2D7|nr:polymorphic toxin-type HINT domain-containing protein [Jidongwangia harbinensis]MCA2214104.1 hypothetical protein [Jidongwangia harbinensis]